MTQPLQQRETGDRARLRVLLATEREPDAEGLGGVEIHVADLAASLESDIEPFGAHLRAGRLIVESFRPARRELGSLPRGQSAEAWTTALLALDIDVLHVHSPQVGPDVLAAAASAAGCQVALTLHDTTLARLDASALASAASVVIAPSRFIRDLVSGRYPELQASTRLITWGVPRQQQTRMRQSGSLRVAVLGVLAPDKGSERLPALMQACKGLGIEWHLFGATEGRSLRAIRQADPGVVAHGAYRRAKLGALLAEAEIDLGLLPSIVPESFSLTLSECASAAVPVVASAVGALAERVESEECGWLFDPHEPQSLAGVLAKLGDRVELSSVKAKLASRPTRTPEDMAVDHAAAYRELGRRSPEVAPEPRRAEARRAFEARGASRANALRQAWRAVRRSKLYRELPLRRLLPEPVRKRIERIAQALMARLVR